MCVCVCVCVYISQVVGVSSGFPIKTLSTFHPSSMCITCLVPLILPKNSLQGVQTMKLLIMRFSSAFRDFTIYIFSLGSSSHTPSFYVLPLM